MQCQQPGDASPARSTMSASELKWVTAESLESTPETEGGDHDEVETNAQDRSVSSLGMVSMEDVPVVDEPTQMTHVEAIGRFIEQKQVFWTRGSDEPVYFEDLEAQEKCAWLNFLMRGPSITKQMIAGMPTSNSEHAEGHKRVDSVVTEKYHGILENDRTVGNLTFSSEDSKEPAGDGQLVWPEGVPLIPDRDDPYQAVVKVRDCNGNFRQNWEGQYIMKLVVRAAQVYRHSSKN